MSWDSPTQGRVELLPQQKVVASLVHPASPVSRLLCDHNTGSGKTLCMVRIVDNFYFDGRPKVLVFPKETVANNFLESLFQWPSRWRDFVCHQNPAAARLASDKEDWWQVRHDRWHLDRSEALQRRASSEGLGLQQAIKEFCVNPMRATLEMKRAFIRGKASTAWVDNYWSAPNPREIHPPAAPLRAYRFTSAGGRAAELVDGVPRGCVFKVGFDTATKNPYSGKVVVMDEGHNLTRPNRLFQGQLDNLRQYMEGATNTVFVSCTGSMEADSSSDPRKLLDAVKGEQNRGLTDEGFLSSHHKRGASFPLQQPAPCADGIYSSQVQSQVTAYTELAGTSLVRYVYQAIKLQKEGKGEESLANYTNMYVYFGSSGQPACRQTLLHNPESRPKFSPVIAAVVEAASRGEKSLVVIRRQTGYKALVALMQHAGEQHGFSVAECENMAEFNHRGNLRGQAFMVLVLEAEKGGEGIEFHAVRHAIYLDVPEGLAVYKQRCGRVVRCGSHSSLPEADRSVRFMFTAAQFPAFARTELGAFALLACCGQWGGPKKVNYNSEPSPEEIIGASKRFARMLERQNISTLAKFHSAWGVSVNEEQVIGEDFSQKLKFRLRKAIEALDEDPDEVKGLIATKTFDEKQMEKLKLQFENMAPSLAKIRGGALDVGFY